MAQGILPPSVAWAQRKNAIILTFNVEDCKNPEIRIEADKIYFKGVGGTDFTEKKEYENTLELYGKIDPEKSKHFLRDRNIEMILIKKSDDSLSGYWPHLLKQKIKYHWLKVDFTRWKDEDDSDDEDGQNTDLEDMIRQLASKEKTPSPTPEIPAPKDLNKEEKPVEEEEPVESPASSDSEKEDFTIQEPVCDISGIDKVLLLQRLWENTNVLGLGALRFAERLNLPFNKKMAAKCVQDYVDYFDGRPIKCDLTGDKAYTRLYDRDSSKPFKNVVNDIRIEMSELNKVD